jgi:hypothetical protein
VALRVSVNTGLGRGVGFVAATVAFSAILVAIAFAVKRPRLPDQQPTSGQLQTSVASMEEKLLLPVEDICISPDAPETAWTRALAAKIGGQPEYPVPFGRVDVKTEFFAIEVDHLAKWHEGIGQALHYATATGLRPALALIISPQPSASHDSALLHQIDQTALQNGIRVFLVRAKC